MPPQAATRHEPQVEPLRIRPRQVPAEFVRQLAAPMAQGVLGQPAFGRHFGKRFAKNLLPIEDDHAHRWIARHLQLDEKA